MAPPEMHFSGRHNGLYLYFSRLLRPLWHRTLVIPGSEPQKPLTSSVSPEEVEWIVIQLLDLRSFLEKQMTSMTSMIPTGVHPHDNAHIQEAYLRKDLKEKWVILVFLVKSILLFFCEIYHFHEFFDISGERQSLMFLQQLINHSLQVLGLWKVVCSHGFELLSRSLTPEDQNMIRGLYFRDLIISLSGKEVCGKLIQALISVYLGDDARTG